LLTPTSAPGRHPDGLPAQIPGTWLSKQGVRTEAWWARWRLWPPFDWTFRITPRAERISMWFRDVTSCRCVAPICDLYFWSISDRN